MNSKTLHQIVISILSISILWSNSCKASDKENLVSEELIKPSSSFLRPQDFTYSSLDSIPKEKIQEMVLDEPGILPGLMLTNKNNFNKVKIFVEAVTYFYKGYESLKEKYCNLYKRKVYFFLKDESLDDFNAFKIGFPQLSFGIGNNKLQVEILLPTYNFIRFCFKENAKMPQKSLAKHPEFYTTSHSEHLLKFNYLKLYLLNKQQYEVNEFVLNGIYDIIDCLKNSWINGTPAPALYCREDTKGHSPLNLMEYLHQNNINENNFTSLFKKTLVIYKLIVLNRKNYNSIFEPLEVDKKRLQDIPVNVDKISETIARLFEECEKDLKDITLKRWNIVNQMQNILKLG